VHQRQHPTLVGHDLEPGAERCGKGVFVCLVAHLEVTTEEHDAGRIDLAETDSLVALKWHAGPMQERPAAVKSTKTGCLGRSSS
jgi:hypothetical protein